MMLFALNVLVYRWGKLSVSIAVDEHTTPKRKEEQQQPKGEPLPSSVGINPRCSLSEAHQQEILDRRQATRSVLPNLGHAALSPYRHDLRYTLRDRAWSHVL